MSTRDTLGLTKQQWEAIHAIEAAGNSVTYLRQPIGADPYFHAYKDGENRRFTITDEGEVTWHERRPGITTMPGSSASSPTAGASSAG